MNDQEKQSTARPAGFDIGGIAIAGETAAPAPEKPSDQAAPLPEAETAGLTPPLPEPAETEEPEEEPIVPAATPDRERRRVSPGRRLLLPGMAVAGLLLCYLLLSQLLVSLAAPRLLADRLSRQLERPVTIARADWQPLRLVLTLHNGIVGPRRADPHDRIDPLLSFRALSADFRPAALFRGGQLIGELTVEQPFLHLLRDEERAYNFATPAFEAIAAGLRPELLNIRNGRLAYTDRGHSPPPATEASGEFNLELQQINGRLWRHPADANAGINLDLQAAGPEAAAIRLRGRLTGQAPDLAKDLQLTVERLPLTVLADYLHPLLGQEIDRGRLTLQARFRSTPDLQLQIDQQLQLQELQLGRRLNGQHEGDPLLLQALLSDREQALSLQLPLTIQTRRQDSPYLLELAAVLAQLLRQAESDPLTLLAADYPGLTSRIDFAAGSAELSREAGRALERLAAALGGRPRLQLEIGSLADPACDREALLARQQAQLEEQRRRAVATLARELAAGELRITAEEISRLRSARAAAGDSELLGLAAERQQAVRQRLIVAMDLTEEEAQARLRPTPPAVGRGGDPARPGCGAATFRFRP